LKIDLVPFSFFIIVCGDYLLKELLNTASTYNEKDLLLRIAAGDEQAFGQLLRAYGETVYSQAIAYTKSVETAEELTQDVFLRVWRNREKLPDLASFENWLFIIARNLIFDSFRKKIQAPVPAIADTDPATPALQMEYKESYQLLLNGINQLPEKRQRVFRMSRLEGKTHEQIAEELGINKVTVAQYIVLSLNFLKTYLKENTGNTILVLILLRGWS